ETLSEREPLLCSRSNRRWQVVVLDIHRPPKVDPRYFGTGHEPERKKDISIIMKKVPNFKSEDEERNFWASHDSTEYVDWAKANRIVLSKLKPSVRTISLRLPESMLEELKLIANKRDVPYQSLVKIFLAERIEEEIR